MIKCFDNTALISFIDGIFCLIPDLCHMFLCPQCRVPVTDSFSHFDSDRFSYVLSIPKLLSYCSVLWPFYWGILAKVLLKNPALHFYIKKTKIFISLQKVNLDDSVSISLSWDLSVFSRKLITTCPVIPI